MRTNKAISITVTLWLISRLPAFGVEPTAITVIEGNKVFYAGKTVLLIGFEVPALGVFAGCASERMLAVKTVARLTELIARGSLHLEILPCVCGPGERACRVTGTCGIMTVAGVNIGDILVDENLARPSASTSPSWCVDSKVSCGL